MKKKFNNFLSMYNIKIDDVHNFYQKCIDLECFQLSNLIIDLYDLKDNHTVNIFTMDEDINETNIDDNNNYNTLIYSIIIDDVENIDKYTNTIDNFDYNQNEIIMIALYNNRLNFIKKFIEIGAIIDFDDNKVLKIAIRNNFIEIFKLICNHLKKIYGNFFANKLSNILEYAIKMRNFKMGKYLITMGVDVTLLSNRSRQITESYCLTNTDQNIYNKVVELLEKN